MELPEEINKKIIEWLASMGYPVDSMPKGLLRSIFVREAHQWQVSPATLAAIISEGAKKAEIVELDAPRYVAHDIQPLTLTDMFAGSSG